MSALDRITAQAAALGSSQAEDEFSAGHDNPVDAPLSGEWAGDLTPADLATRCGFSPYNDADSSAACEAFEDAYFGTWQGLQSAREEVPC